MCCVYSYMTGDYCVHVLCLPQSEEMYICIYSHREGDTLLFYHEGGVEIGDVDAKVT